MLCLEHNELNKILWVSLERLGGRAGGRRGRGGGGQMGSSSWVSLQGQIERLTQNPREVQAISSISIQTASSRHQLLEAKDPSGAAGSYPCNKYLACGRRELPGVGGAQDSKMVTERAMG